MTDALFTLAESKCLDIEGEFASDNCVLEKLPPGAVILSVKSHGSSTFARTACVDVNLPDGSAKRYFLKVAFGGGGKIIIEGEFNSMTALYETMPSFVPKPHAWGQFKAATIPTYFYLCEFIDMDCSLPKVNTFCAKLAQLHRDSVSPTGKFGFHITTFQGKCPQVVGWDSNWASFFAKLFDGAVKADRETNGPWKALDEVSGRVVTHVIPRLLGVLQADGRVLKPCLIHGDLWEGNIGTDSETGNIYIFDAGAYYAHNEMEIGMWRCTRYKMKSEKYKTQYAREFGISEPRDEWEDRNRLYSAKINIIYSAHHAGSIVRQIAFEDLNFLVEKYAPVTTGEGVAPESASSIPDVETSPS